MRRLKSSQQSAIRNILRHIRKLKKETNSNETFQTSSIDFVSQGSLRSLKYYQHSQHIKNIKNEKSHILKLKWILKKLKIRTFWYTKKTQFTFLNVVAECIMSWRGLEPISWTKLTSWHCLITLLIWILSEISCVVLKQYKPLAVHTLPNFDLMPFLRKEPHITYHNVSFTLI